MKKLCLLFGICLALSAPVSTMAQPSGFSSALRAYDAHQYSLALDQFSRIEKSNPSDAAVHYYKGLCYQAMNQMSLAKQEYSWVAAYGTGSWKINAQTALQNLQKYPKNYQSANYATATQTGRTAAASSASNNGNGSFKGRLKILEFSAVWCRPCAAFAPIWESVSSRLRGPKLDFQHLDIDEPNGQSLASKYAVSAVPTFVYTDDSGQPLKVRKGAYPDEGSFIVDINSFFAKQ
jgi:thiol-disulfide isomerase/thioredoxin